MITDREVRDHVLTALGEHAADHDVDGIVRELIHEHGLEQATGLDDDVFWTVVQRHQRREPRSEP